MKCLLGFHSIMKNFGKFLQTFKTHPIQLKHSLKFAINHPTSPIAYLLTLESIAKQYYDSAFLILSPPAKRHRRDVTMHAVHFGTREMLSV